LPCKGCSVADAVVAPRNAPPGIRHGATPAGPAPADVAGNPPRRNAAATPEPLRRMDVAALRQFWRSWAVRTSGLTD